MLGAVVGGDVVEERIRSATETAKRPVDGKEITCYALWLSGISSVCVQVLF